MSTVPVMSYGYPVYSTACTSMQPKVQPASMEAFEGETQVLMTAYENYMKNVGGYQNINGHMVHVTTAMHTDSLAFQTAEAISKRLIALGALPNPYQTTHVA